MSVIMRTSYLGQTICMDRHTGSGVALESLRKQFPEEYEEFKALDDLTKYHMFIDYLDIEHGISVEIKVESLVSTIEDLLVGDIAIEVAAMHAVAALKDTEEVAIELLEKFEEEVAEVAAAARKTLENKLMECLERMLKDE